MLMNKAQRTHDFTKEQYIAEITKILQRIDWWWLLDLIYSITVNLVKGTEYETEESEV